MKKITAVTVFFDDYEQERKETKIITAMRSVHFEIGAALAMGDKEVRVRKIREKFFGGVSVTFSNGVTWSYSKNFKYIVS